MCNIFTKKIFILKIFLLVTISSCFLTGCLLTGIAANLLSNEKTFNGYEDDGTLRKKYEDKIANIAEYYIHENKESRSGIFLFPEDEYNILSINSEDIFYKVVSIRIVDFPSYISAGDNPFTTKIILQDGYGNKKTLLNKFYFVCQTKEKNSFSYNDFWKNFLSSNNIESSWEYESPIKIFERGKIYRFESIYIFKLYQQIQKNKDLQQAVNDFFSDNLAWDFLSWRREEIRMFPIGESLRDSCGYFYTYFTVKDSSYNIVSGKDDDTYLILSYQEEPLAVILDKVGAIKYKETKQYYSFQQGEYGIDYYDFIRDKCVVCRKTKKTMPVMLSNGRTIEIRVYETNIMNKQSPLYWEDEESFQKIWHIQWNNSTWVSYYKQENEVIMGRYWEYYCLAVAAGDKLPKNAGEKFPLLGI